MKLDSTTITTDVLVVGGGGAAARAALEARMGGVDVTLMVKGSFGSIGIRGAGSTAGGVSDRGGVDYAGAPGIQGFGRDSKKGLTPERDYENIIQLGLGMTDHKLAQVMAEKSAEIMRPLVEEWTTEIFPRQWGMKSHGIPIMMALAPLVRKSGVKVMEHTMVVDLLVRDGEVTGAVAVDEKTGGVTIVKTGAVILGTGGMGGMFKHSLTNPCTTGDGHAMAYRAGAQQMNLEFKQVFPGVINPTINHFSAWFFVPGVKIYNARGEEFIEKYLPEGISLEEVYTQRAMHGPFSARDSASRYFDVATLIETKEGRANENDALYVDLTGSRIGDPLDPLRREYFYYRGVRYMENPVQYNICFHCTNGGLRVDENGESSVRGLYAAGETAAGMHGANRLAGHMLGASQVFGTLAARHAVAERVGKNLLEPTESEIIDALGEISMLADQSGSESPGAVIADVQTLAWNNMLVHQNEKLLTEAIEGLAAVDRDRLPACRTDSPQDLIDILELRNMLVAGDLLGRTTRIRTESRGDQYREDYPERNDTEWAKVILVDRGEREPVLKTEIIDPEWVIQGERPGDMQGERWG